MKVTIDSTEPLADALRVIGALYNITLAQVDKAPVAGMPSASRRSSGRSVAKSGSSRRAATGNATRPAGEPKPTRSARKAPAPSTSEIRTWAQANGHTVSSRGTLPAAVKAAYAEAHRSVHLAARS